MRSTALLLLVCSFLVIGSGCAARSSGPMQLPIEAFSGHAIRTSSGTWFTACGHSTRWWVTFVDASVRQFEEARRAGLLADDQPAFVRWRASRTDERLVGPGGPALLVRDIFEIRASRPGDCAAELPRHKL